MTDPKEKEVKDLVKDLRLAAGDPNNQDWGARYSLSVLDAATRQVSLWLEGSLKDA
jgi:hypothetical protein